MKNIKIITLSFVSLLLLFTLFGAPRSNDSVAAATTRELCEGSGGTYTQRYNDSSGTTEASCTCSGNKPVDGSGRCAFVESKPTVAPKYVENDFQTGPNESLNEGNCGIIRYLVIIINLLSALVGVVIVGSIIWAGIQYSMAGSDPQKVSAAKDRIRNALIALFFFLFMYGLLNYLVPGGVL